LTDCLKAKYLVQGYGFVNVWAHDMTMLCSWKKEALLLLLPIYLALCSFLLASTSCLLSLMM